MSHRRQVSMRCTHGILLAALSLAVACRSGEDGVEARGRAIPASAPRAGQPASIVGTVVDASTRVAVAGVIVEGPNGARAETDELGRFKLDGLQAGSAGLLRATALDGRCGENRLRPLPPLSQGPLEVVIFLR